MVAPCWYIKKSTVGIFTPPKYARLKKMVFISNTLFVIIASNVIGPAPITPGPPIETVLSELKDIEIKGFSVLLN